MLLVPLLVGSVPLAAQQFGGSLAVSGDQVLVGETQNQSLPGIVYAYRSDGGAWREIAQLMVSNETGKPDAFGRALAADDVTMLAGAPAMGEGRGTVFVFERNASGAWTQLAALTPVEPADTIPAASP